jgi:putative DNA primase/helicase
MSRRMALENVPAGDRSPEQAQELVEVRERLRLIAEVEKALKDRRSSHRRFATTTGNTARMDNALKEAGVSLAVDFELLDADPLEVNCETGCLRFSVAEMGEEGGGRVAEMVLVPHAREQRLSKLMPVAYDPAAPRDRFEAFLERVQPDREMREFLKRWMGLSLTGLPMQRLVFFYGGGANGKSVLVDLIARIMGNYAATARIESLTGTNRRGGSEATPDLIPLMGARMVRTSEPDEGQRLQEGLIKELTGGEPIQVRALHSDFIEVRPVFKLTMSGNHKPDIRGTDDGIWRRVMLVPFDVQIPEAERDPTLIDKLFEERAGVFNWLIEGLMDFLEGGLAPPEAVRDATREYREESDPIGVFLTTCCVITGEPADTVTSKELGDAFGYHLIERGMSPWKPATVARQLAAKARHWRHPQSGRMFAKGKASISQYVGLRLTDAFRRRFDAAPKDHQGRPLGVARDGESPHPAGDF